MATCGPSCVCTGAAGGGVRAGRCHGGHPRRRTATAMARGVVEYQDWLSSLDARTDHEGAVGARLPADRATAPARAPPENGRAFQRQDLDRDGTGREGLAAPRSEGAHAGDLRQAHSRQPQRIRRSRGPAVNPLFKTRFGNGQSPHPHACLGARYNCCGLDRERVDHAAG